MALPSVADLLKWQLPPCVILMVVLLKFSQVGDPTAAPIQFAEFFAGCGALSTGLRMVSRA